MVKYKISLDVVRKANENMQRRLKSDNVGGNLPKGEVVLKFRAGLLSRRIKLTNGQIKAAYRKAMDTANAKAV